MKKKIVIIGAGPAGITAGYELVRQSDEYDVLILEQSNTIGGIARTINCNGNRMDIGGHRFFSKNKQVMSWWEEVMPLQGKPSYDDKILNRKVKLKTDGPDPEIEDRVMLLRNRTSRIYYQKKFFDYPVKLNWNTIKNLGLYITIKAVLGYIKAMIGKLPEISLENFYINRFGKTLYMMFFEEYTEKLWGRHPREISADWGSQRVRGLSILTMLKHNIERVFPEKRRTIETSLIEAFYYPKFGPGELWEAAVSDFEKMHGEVRKNCCVTKILTKNNVVKEIEYMRDGLTYREPVDYVISSMPLKDLVEGMNDVPERCKKIAKGLPYREFVTVGILVEKLHLKNETKLKTLNHLIPDCWVYVQDSSVKLGRIQLFNNWSPYMVKDPEETVWIGLEYFCNEGDVFWNMGEAQWKDFSMHELKKMGVISEHTRLLDYHCEKVKKAYPAYFDTYKDIDQLIAWLNQCYNLSCIGRNGQHHYNNMDHSMITAFEAVKNIILGDVDKSNIWNVNVEKVYHET